MSEGGFLAPTRPRPLGMALVIAIHTAVLAALLLAKGELLPPRDKIMIGTNIPLDKVPPPDPQTYRSADRRPNSSDTRVSTPTQTQIDNPTQILELPTLPPLPQPAPGSESGIRISEPAPLLVDAKIDPRFASDFQPVYPASAQREGIEGKATVRVHIGADGRVNAVEMVSATDPAFFDATKRQALRRWRFSPATRDGAAVESVKVMTVTFVLQNG